MQTKTTKTFECRRSLFFAFWRAGPLVSLTRHISLHYSPWLKILGKYNEGPKAQKSEIVRNSCHNCQSLKYVHLMFNGVIKVQVTTCP